MKEGGKLIVALDVDTKEKALKLIELLKSETKFFKVGLELFSSCGPAVVAEVKERGCEVFLDLKLHDIPNTVAKTAVSIARLGASIINLHALGGYDMMKKAAEAVKEEAARLKIKKPKLIAVTVLTSTDEIGLKKVGIGDSMEKQVLRLAVLAKEAGLDGVVASPSEIKLIRKELGRDFLIVTPGVRPAWGEKNDQKRIATPVEAITNGADYIVVGRPITEAKDPADAAKKILKELSA